MRLLQTKILFLILAVLAAAAGIIVHNYETAQDAMTKLQRSQSKAFDGGSIAKAIKTWIPK